MAKTKLNAVIAQSGGPTAVINNSIRGVIDVLKKSGRVNKIFGARMGILGVLTEDLLDISAQSPEQIKLLSRTPSAGTLGSCRYKIKSQDDMERIIEVFRNHDVGYFFYCGGGDSMDTASKVGKTAKHQNLDIICTGIPKTIDNDVGGPLQPDGVFGVCDHNPGYGSTARSLAVNILEANEENKASYTSDPVLVIGVMGRRIGFIPAAARLADPERKIPLVIILPEVFDPKDAQKNLEDITLKVNEKLHSAGRCIVVIGEGVQVGDLGVFHDAFGHEEFGACERAAEQLLKNYLNGTDLKDANGRSKSRLAIRGIARSEAPGTRQRREMSLVSTVDLKEAYEAGKKAAQIALSGETGYMSTIVRRPGTKYHVAFEKVPLEVVANSSRKLPEKWISKDRIDVTDEFVRWALPLIGGPVPEFARFREIKPDKKCGKYVPTGFR